MKLKLLITLTLSFLGISNAFSANVTLAYEYRNELFKVDGFEDRKPFMMKEGAKRFFGQHGVWHLEGDLDEIKQLGYLPNCFRLMQLGQKFRLRDSDPKYSLIFSRNESIPSESSNTFVYWDWEALDDVIIAIAWLSDRDTSVRLYYLSKEGFPQFVFEELNAYSLINGNTEGYPIFLLFDAETLKLHKPQIKKDEGTKAHLNWLVKTGNTEYFQQQWHSLDNQPVYKDREANPFVLSALYNGESILRSVPEIEDYSQLKYITGQPAHYYISARGNLEFAKGIHDRELYNEPDQYGTYPIHQAIHHGHDNLAFWFINELDQARLISNDGKLTAMSRAIRMKRHEIFERLMTLDAPIPRYDEDEITKIYGSVLSGGNPQMIRFLLEQYPELEKKYEHARFLEDAIEFGNIETVRILIPQLKRIKTTNWLTKATFLHSASHFASSDVISLLVENGFKVNDKLAGGSTPLYYAKTSLRGREASLQLLKLGANPNIGPKNEPSVLQLALLENDWELIEELIKAGASVKDRELMNNIVGLAIRNDARSVVELLFNRGFLKNLQFSEGIPIVAAADYYSNDTLVDFCEENGQSLELNPLQLIAPSKLDNKIQFIERKPLRYPDSIYREHGPINTRVTAIINKRGRLILPKFEPELANPVADFAIEMITGWKLAVPKLKGKAVDVKVAFPLSIDGSLKDDPIYQLGDLSKFYHVPDNEVKATIRVAPIIPDYIKKRANTKDSITLSFVVTDKGSVIEAKVISENANEELSENSLKAIRQWRFEPAEKDGVTIRSKREITIFFEKNRMHWEPKF